MMGTINGDVLQKAFRVVITNATQDDYEGRLEKRKAQQERQMRLQSREKEAEKPQTVRRQMAKIGRNDPCPCGSGKKYKKCCGAQNAVA